MNYCSFHNGVRECDSYLKYYYEYDKNGKFNKVYDTWFCDECITNYQELYDKLQEMGMK